MKKIFLWFLITISLTLWNLSYSIDCNINDLASHCYEFNSTSYWMGSDNVNIYQDAEETIDDVLEVIVNKLMIWFWVLALFIMTVGWGYMIFAHGQDELLNKWKSIFSAWIISLLVALWSWIIMKIVISLLY